MANLTKCTICGAEYSYCPTCSGTHAWKFYTDTHEHYQIFMVLKQYDAGMITKSNAKETLEYIGITAKSDLNIFRPRVVEKIKDILTVEVPVEEKTVLKKTKKSKLYKDD